MPSFTRKQLRATFVLANSAEFNEGKNTLQVEGLRILSDTNFAGGMNAPSTTMRIYGMLQSDMNQLTMLSYQALAVERNTVVLEASEDGVAWSQVFSGNIIDGGPNYQSSPEAFFEVHGQALYFARMTPFDVSSYPAEVNAADAVGAIASSLGLKAETNGVNFPLSNSYLPSTAVDQLNAIVEHANLDVYVEGDTLAVTPKGVARGTITSILDPSSGLVGYPTLLVTGLRLVSYYRPDFRFGGTVEVRNSDVPKANGTWRICGMRHVLESERPNANWLTFLEVTPPNVIGVSRG